LSKNIWIGAGLAWLTAANGFSQHEGHSPAPTPAASADAPSHPAERNDERRLFQSDMELMNGMTPDDSMGSMAMPGWHVMDLGIARLSFNGQGGPSGRKGAESSNWNMLHVQHDLWGGRLSFMMMNSLEPATFPKGGSAELFQTGETYRNEPLVDRQHPHDFFMNLSATWRRSLGDRSAVWIQLAPVGDPALGPTTYMHRASAGENPTAPLGHHWEDSTHITFDVITAGWGWRFLSIEGSAFHGAEPDEDRWGIESGSLDSASGRIWLRFRDGWSGQVSYGFLKNPERAEPGSLHRLTASVSYGAAGDRPFAATLLWGRNDEEHGRTWAWLLEWAWQRTASDQLYGRLEYVQKDDALLAFKGPPPAGAPGVAGLANVFAFTAGYLRDFDLLEELETGLGADVSVYSFPAGLRPVYDDFPVSGHVFVRLRWNATLAGGHSM